MVWQDGDTGKDPEQKLEEINQNSAEVFQRSITNLLLRIRVIAQDMWWSAIAPLSLFTWFCKLKLQIVKIEEAFTSFRV